MTGLSLREQLLAAGLGTKKQAKQADQEHRQQEQRRHEQRHQAKRQPEPQQPTPAQLAQAAKAARDKELNRKRQEQVELRAREAEIKQLIEQNRLPRLESDEYYNFVHGKKIRRVAVDAQRREQIMAGTIFVVRYHGQTAVVPAEIAEKIRARDARAVVTHSNDAPTEGGVEDDPYKDFVVPDDLTW
jgi:uncharacterized protein YaiL (DUF2058 family)